MPLNLFSIIFLLGSIQGLILALVLLFSKNDKRQAKYFLAFLISVLSYDLFETALSVQDIQIITSKIFPVSLLFTLGASLYLTIKTSLSSDKIAPKKILLFYLPPIIDGVISLFIFTLRYKPFYAPNLTKADFTAIYNAYFIPARLLVVFIFWIYFYFAAGRFREYEKQNFADELHTTDAERGIVKKWLRSFLVVCSFIALVWTLTIFGVVFFDRQNVFYFYYPLEFLLAILIYWIGFAGYHRIKIVYLNEQKNTRAFYDKIPGKEIEKAVAAISSAMTTDRIYLDPELNIAKLAAHVGYPPKTVSAVLNQHMNIGFNEFVNGFRVEEVKQRLLKIQNENQTITTVAFDSGFNSLATFQRVFKNATGITPKQFSANNQQKS